MPSRRHASAIDRAAPISEATVHGAVEVAVAKKLSKQTVKKGHKVAKAIIREGRDDAVNPYAVGTAVAKKAAKKRKAKK